MQLSLTSIVSISFLLNADNKLFKMTLTTSLCNENNKSRIFFNVAYELRIHYDNYFTLIPPFSSTFTSAFVMEVVNRFKTVQMRIVTVSHILRLKSLP